MVAEAKYSLEVSKTKMEMKAMYLDLQYIFHQKYSVQYFTPGTRRE